MAGKRPKPKATKSNKAGRTRRPHRRLKIRDRQKSARIHTEAAKKALELLERACANKKLSCLNATTFQAVMDDKACATEWKKDTINECEDRYQAGIRSRLEAIFEQHAQRANVPGQKAAKAYLKNQLYLLRRSATTVNMNDDVGASETAAEVTKDETSKEDTAGPRAAEPPTREADRVGAPTRWEAGQLVAEARHKIHQNQFRKGQVVKPGAERPTAEWLQNIHLAVETDILWETGEKGWVIEMVGRGCAKEVENMGGVAITTLAEWMRGEKNGGITTEVKTLTTRNNSLMMVRSMKDAFGLTCDATVETTLLGPLGHAAVHEIPWHLGSNSRDAMDAVTPCQAMAMVGQGFHLPSATQAIKTALELGGVEEEEVDIVNIGCGMGTAEEALQSLGRRVNVVAAAETNAKCIRAHQAATGAQTSAYVGAIGTAASIKRIMERANELKQGKSKGKIGLLVISLQCAAYSGANRSAVNSDERQQRLRMARQELTAAAILVQKLQPRAVVYENVAGLLNPKWKNEWLMIREILSPARRTWRYQVVHPNAGRDGGVSRARVYMISGKRA